MRVTHYKLNMLSTLITPVTSISVHIYIRLTHVKNFYNQKYVQIKLRISISIYINILLKINKINNLIVYKK